MIISAVELFELIGHRQAGEPLAGNRQAQALDIYPEYNARDWAHERPAGCTKFAPCTLKFKRIKGLRVCSGRSRKTRLLSSRNSCARSWSAAIRWLPNAERPDATPEPPRSLGDVHDRGQRRRLRLMGFEGQGLGATYIPVVRRPDPACCSGICQHVGFFHRA